MIRLVATDLDGTLLDEESRVPPETFDLIRELAEVGVRFCVCSGRPPHTALPVVESVLDEIDMVCANGTHVTVAGEPLVRDTFDRAALDELFGIVFERYPMLHPCLGGTDGNYHLVTRTDDDVDAFFRAWPEHTTLIGPPPADVGVLSCEMFSSVQADLSEAEAFLNDAMGDVFDFHRLGVPIVDATPKGVSKRPGLSRVLEAHGLSRDEVVAYGDAMNDCDLFACAGHPRAVGNALDELKALAERVVETNAEHGVQRDMARILADLRAGGDGLGTGEAPA